MNKRGIQHIQYISINYLFLGAFMLLFMLGGTRAIAQNTYIKQEYQGRDLALLVDSMQIADGEIEVKYPSGEGFNYKFEGDKVIVKEKIPYVAYYGEDANDTLNIGKEGNLIVIQKNE